jgi:hypothetical protein
MVPTLHETGWRSGRGQDYIEPTTARVLVQLPKKTKLGNKEIFS